VTIIEAKTLFKLILKKVKKIRKSKNIRKNLTKKKHKKEEGHGTRVL
jgi:hypothetical protein